MLGIEAQYRPNLPDQALLELALSQNLVLVTRDADLARRTRKMGAESVVVETDQVAENIAVVVRRIGLRIDVNPENSRCPKCGRCLSAISREEARTLVPSRTFEAYDSFWKCQGCGQTYWKGAHWTSISQQIREIEQMLSSENPN